MPLYSHSRLSAFEQCPLKFRFKRVDKADEWVAGKVDERGTVA